MFPEVRELLIMHEENEVLIMRNDLSRYKNIRFSEKGFAIDNMIRQGMRKELPPKQEIEAFNEMVYGEPLNKWHPTK